MLKKGKSWIGKIKSDSFALFIDMYSRLKYDTKQSLFLKDHLSRYCTLYVIFANVLHVHGFTVEEK